MSNDIIQPGDVVRLKSGGPDMTVKEIYAEDQEAVCIWFENKTKRMEENFPLVTISKVEGGGIGFLVV